MFKSKNSPAIVKVTKTNSYQRAFTLIELLVVIAIISLLSAVVLSSLASAKMKANDTKISQDLRQFRIAAEMYYNDNHMYPSGYVGTLNGQSKNFAQDNQSTDFWMNKLAFFTDTKVANAASGHRTPLCNNFDIMAGEMVTKKYLSTIPVHPYDNDADGICYKAATSTVNFAVYAILNTQVALTGGGTISKRSVFILGDTSAAAVAILNSGITTTPKIDGLSEERAIAVDSTGIFTATDLASSYDAVDGFTSGASGVSSGVGNFVDTVITVISPIFGGPGGNPPPPTYPAPELICAPGIDGPTVENGGCGIFCPTGFVLHNGSNPTCTPN